MSAPQGDDLLDQCRTPAERAAARRFIDALDRSIADASGAGVDISLFYVALFQRLYGALAALHGAPEVLAGLEAFIRSRRAPLGFAGIQRLM